MLKILWDWNGTLLDDVRLCHACINRLLSSENLPVLPEISHYRDVFGFPIQNYYEKVGFDFSKTAWEDLAEAYMKDYMSLWQTCSLTPGARESLAAAKSYGFDNIVLSASRLDYLKEQIDAYDLSGVLDAVYGIDDIYAHSKAELTKAFAKTCLPQDVICMIGDTDHDAYNASILHAFCILVETGHQSKERLLATGCPVAASTAEALEMIMRKYPEQIRPWQSILPEGMDAQTTKPQKRTACGREEPDSQHTSACRRTHITCTGDRMGDAKKRQEEGKRSR